VILLGIVGYYIESTDILYHYAVMKKIKTQEDQALSALRKKGMMRSFEFGDAGITAATLSRMKAKGLIIQLQRGLYTLPGATSDINHEMAQVTKTVPHGIVCLISALSFHDLTDTIPGRLWIAIDPKDRRPKITHPPLQIVRFPAELRSGGTDRHVIDGVSVRITNPARTVVDLFRYRKTTGLNLAIEGLREALRQRKATPAQIARYAEQAKVWKIVQPYLEAVTSNA
jgi:predicted transcriptional regulator of viral defense system